MQLYPKIYKLDFLFQLGMCNRLATNFDKVKGLGSKFITLNMFVRLVYFHTRKTATCANVTEATERFTLRGLVVTAHICKSVVIIREIVLIVVLLAQGIDA